ncbi:MAG TPA: class I SAM-dependent methyltransferase [Candidatus Acidoferrales bacterium]|nr:class I SAM-dependent methyltransferase [Candidatus Acidoferrales bacterium]
MSDLRRAWSALIEADDYERHMAAVGQPQANAALLDELFTGFPPPPGARIHFVGSGTGQYFDYWQPAALSGYHLTFTDINSAYLARLTSRLGAMPAVVQVDDIEAPALNGPFDLAIVILVLEHVDWHRAVAALCDRADRVFVVIQQNPPDLPVLDLPGTMSILRQACPHLIGRAELIEAFRREGLPLVRTSFREVPDRKHMAGLDFMRQH